MQRSHLRDVAEFHAAELGLPLVKGVRTHAVFAAEVLGRYAGIVLFYDRNDLSVAESGLSHTVSFERLCLGNRLIRWDTFEGSDHAERVAEQLYSAIGEGTEDEDLLELVRFLKREIHSDYRLAKYVAKGIAFHYGNMPQIIRSRIEELFRRRQLRYLCCTSTLLQGMNLPAKNIFLEDPRKGRGSQMKAGDFWNLAGRAGRLAKEFEGNVFCVFGKPWQVDVSSDRMSSIDSAFHVAVNKRTAEFSHAVVDPPESAEAKEYSWAEQAYAKVFADYVATGKLLSETSAERADEFKAIDEYTSSFKRTLPDELYVNNFYLHPGRLEALAKVFRTSGTLRSLVPVKPGTTKSYEVLVSIFGIIEDIFVKSGYQRCRYYAFLANNWMQGISLCDLIANAVNYNAIDGEEAVNHLIRDIFETIEKQLRFVYVKYMRLYNDVLRAVLTERGDVLRAEKLLPIHLFLEYGAATQTLINLMSIGLSRTSAIHFAKEASLRDDLSTRACQATIDRVNLDYSTLSDICKREIFHLRRMPR